MLVFFSFFLKCDFLERFFFSIFRNRKEELLELKHLRENGKNIRHEIINIKDKILFS